MERINIKFFGTPYVSIGDRRIAFPSRKVEALCYYIVVNKEASREELSCMLWPDANTQAGRKNTRNAVYCLKKSLGMDVVISPQKTTILLNPEISISSDLELLMSNNKWIDAYTGDFLQGFTLKEEEFLENWIMSSREKYKSMYVQKLYEKIKKDFFHSSYESAEQCARRLIEIDQYDEKAYRVLMKVYSEKGMYNKAINIYNRLCLVLEKDLGIAPDIKSRMLFQKMQEVRNNYEIGVSAKKQNYFYGRHQELVRLISNYNSFKCGRNYKSILIIGEAGIGKTALKNRFLEKVKADEVFILESNCYQAESEYPLKPWVGIVGKMLKIAEIEKIQIPIIWEDIIASFFPSFAVRGRKSEVYLTGNSSVLKLEVLEATIASLLNEISKIKKTIVVFDDIQWIDKISMSVLSSILLHLNGGILFIGACRRGVTLTIENFIIEMTKHDRLEKMELNRFTKAEVIDFAKKVLPDYSFNDDMYEKMFIETEGNTFFLVEYLYSLRENKDLDMMSSRMTDIMKSRFIGIGEEGIKMLNIASIFFDEIPVDMILEISGTDKFKLLDILDDLKARFIIKDAGNKQFPSILFTHQKLREFIYNMQSPARRQMLHGRAGRIFESRLIGDNRDMPLLPRLIYHFSNSGDMLSTLKYSIKSVSFYLDFNHELFPVLYGEVNTDNHHSYITVEDSLKLMNNIEEQFTKIKESYPVTDEIIKLKIIFSHIKGRCLIRQGEYEKGIELIKDMIDSSLKLGEIEYVLKGYRQMIFYGIQTRNLQAMKGNIEAGLNMAHKYSLNEDIAMFLRLYGLYNIMNKEYGRAEKLLKQCIQRFQSMDNGIYRYSIHIAAAYSYIGDIRRYNMKFQSSLEYYNKAISLCENRMAGNSLAVICTNAGQAAFDAKDYIIAKKYFTRAIGIYKQIDSIWGRGIAEGYIALLLIKEGQYKEALESMLRADEYSARIKNPYEIGLIYRIKAEIRYNMDSNKKLSKFFSSYLYMDTVSYCEEGIKLLKEVNDKYQIDIFNIFACRSSG